MKRAHEIVNHPIRVGMIDVEAIQLAIRHDINAGEFLRFEHDTRCIRQCLLTWEREEPIRHGITSNDGREYGRRSHII